MRVPMKKQICKRCEVVVVGMAWERDGAEFQRTLLRHCKQCKRDRVSIIHYVDSQLPVCGVCLSQELQRRVSKDPDEKPGLTCAKCGSNTVLTLNDTESDDF